MNSLWGMAIPSREVNLKCKKNPLLSLVAILNLRAVTLSKLFVLFSKGSSLKGMNFLPKGADYFLLEYVPASILYKSIAGRYRPVSYPDGPITTRYRFT